MNNQPMMVSLVLVMICGLQGVGMEAKKKNALKTYQEKRNFKKSKEPEGAAKKKQGKEPLFVVQKHAASHLHYDLRLEVDGVLVSWAVPKGFSLDPSVKHLAVQTEDHPYDYAEFEGTIPQGEYGGGTVMVWDIGTYQNIKEKDGKLVPMDKCLEHGTVEVALAGKKLKGGFALIKMHGRGPNQWLLIKMDDEYANRKRATLPKSWDKSALTKRTMKQIAQEEGE